MIHYSFFEYISRYYDYHLYFRLDRSDCFRLFARATGIRLATNTSPDQTLGPRRKDGRKKAWSKGRGVALVRQFTYPPYPLRHYSTGNGRVDCYKACAQRLRVKSWWWATTVSTPLAGVAASGCSLVERWDLRAWWHRNCVLIFLSQSWIDAYGQLTSVIPSPIVPSSDHSDLQSAATCRKAAMPARRSPFRAPSCKENIVNSTISTWALELIILFFFIFWKHLGQMCTAYGFWCFTRASSSRPAVPLGTQGRVIYLAKGAEKSAAMQFRNFWISLDSRSKKRGKSKNCFVF